MPEEHGRMISLDALYVEEHGRMISLHFSTTFAFCNMHALRKALLMWWLRKESPKEMAD